jgi:peptidyl-prolyl cis-trans isomerase SurA
MSLRILRVSVGTGLLLGASLLHAAAPAPAAAVAAEKPVPAYGTKLDRVVAIVNDGVVLESELDAQNEEFKKRLTAQNVRLPSDKELRDQVLERLVLEEIQAQRATRGGMTVSDEQVNAALERLAQQQNVKFSDLPTKLGEAGYIYADFRSGIRRQMQREMLQQQDVIDRINITPRELEQYMERQKHSASADVEYNVSHILVAVAQDASATDTVAARKKIEDIASRVAKGESFSQLAVTYSDSQTALEGGSLGWLKGTSLPTFLSDTVARLQVGETTGIIQTATGFHLAHLNEKRDGSGPQIVQQYHLRHILMSINEVMDDATVEQKLASLRGKILAGEDFAVVAKANSADPGSAIQGGDLGWSSTDIFVPEFTKVVEGLKENEISQPFRSRYGWHIVQLLGKRDFDNSSNAAKAQALSQLRESRAAEATDLWLQQLRDEAFVELRP